MTQPPGNLPYPPPSRRQLIRLCYKKQLGNRIVNPKVLALGAALVYARRKQEEILSVRISSAHSLDSLAFHQIQTPVILISWGIHLHSAVTVALPRGFFIIGNYPKHYRFCCTVFTDYKMSTKYLYNFNILLKRQMNRHF